MAIRSLLGGSRVNFYMGATKIARHRRNKKSIARMSEIFEETIKSLLQTISANPAILKRKLPEMVAFLQKTLKGRRQGDMEGQGTGNKVTDQEACFADELTKRGFQFLPKDAPNPEAGLYYRYQLKGSQQSLDFGLREYEGGKLKKEIIVDLKHTNSKNFYLNDGWFEKGVYYIVSWNAGTKKKVAHRAHIALGEDIPSAEEHALMAELIAFKRAKNTDTKKVGSLRPYIRFANQYSCERFTPEVAATHLANALATI
jgi:hypothetical protein